MFQLRGFWTGRSCRAVEESGRGLDEGSRVWEVWCIEWIVVIFKELMQGRFFVAYLE